MLNYSFEDQNLIEKTLNNLAEVLCDEIGMRTTFINLSENGDVEAKFFIDGEGSVFCMKISNEGNKVVKEHMYLSEDVPFTRKGDVCNGAN